MDPTDTFLALREARQALITQLTAQGLQEDRVEVLFQTTRGLGAKDGRFEGYYYQLRTLRFIACDTNNILRAFQEAMVKAEILPPETFREEAARVDHVLAPPTPDWCNELLAETES